MQQDLHLLQGSSRKHFPAEILRQSQAVAIFNCWTYLKPAKTGYSIFKTQYNSYAVILYLSLLPVEEAISVLSSDLYFQPISTPCSV